MEILILASLILLNGIFAMSEVALLTARKPRLEAQAKHGDPLAAAAVRLGRDPTRFLSTIQIGITSIGILNGIIGEAFLSAPFSAWLQSTLALQPKTANIVATAGIVIVITYVSIVAGELVPKRLGQHNAEGIARIVAWPMRWLAKISGPFVYLLTVSTNAILNPVLRLLRLRGGQSEGEMSPEELRTILLEYSNFLPRKHVSILINLFDLEAITVEDVMTPRSQIEAIDLEASTESILAHLTTAYHTRLPAYRGELDSLAGILHLRKVMHLVRAEDFDREALAELAAEPYFVPAGTPVFAQLQYFQESRQRIALVVDEYGELQGLVTLEDIIEEIIGEFTTTAPVKSEIEPWDKDGSALVEGSSVLRELNRKLGLALPLDGPKTLNGLILEHLQDIPEAGVALKIAGVPMEIVQTQDRVIKTVRLFRPRAADLAEAA